MTYGLLLAQTRALCIGANLWLPLSRRRLRNVINLKATVATILLIEGLIVALGAALSPVAVVFAVANLT
jgi:hypothetical protein